MSDQSPSVVPIECEIKLTGSKGALRSAEAAVRNLFGRGVDWKSDHLVTDYYDTPDRRLAKRGVALRVRKKNRRYEQTVKAQADKTAALSHRPEWNMPLKFARPDLGQLPDDAKSRVGLVLPGELRKLFTVDVERRKLVAPLPAKGRVGAARVEIAIDRGTVRAGRKSSEICEVEIELVDGAPAAIYALASQLADSGLRIGRITKAGRGYALLDGATTPQPRKAPKFAMRAEQTVSAALSDIFEAGTANLLENEDAAIDGADPEGIHQYRVSIRRMRSAFSVFRSVLDRSRTRGIEAELKWLAGSLGPARDWDVFEDEMLDAVSGAGIDADAVQALKRGAASARRRGYEIARETLLSSRCSKILLRMSQLVDTHGWIPVDAPADHPLNRPLGEISDAILDNAFRKLRKRARGLGKMEIAARHQVRIELKKFRYTTDFLHALYEPAEVGPFMKVLARMQDQFGHLNDVAVAENLLHQLVREKGISAEERRLRSLGAGLVIGWYARAVRDQEERFLADWKALKSAPTFWSKT